MFYAIIVIISLIMILCVGIQRNIHVDTAEVLKEYYDYLEKSDKVEKVNINELVGWLYKTDKPKGTVIYFLGSASSSTNNMYLFLKYNFFEDYNILIVDYPGQQESKGKGNTEAYNNMSLDIYDYLENRNLLDDKIVVLGYSIGTYPGIYLGANRKIDKLILVGAYDNLYNVYILRHNPVRAFIKRNVCKSDEYAEKVEAETLIFTSYEDKNANYELAQNLASKFKNLYKLKIFENLSHYEYFSSEEFWKIINEFIEN